MTLTHLYFPPTTYDKQTIYSYPQNPRVFKALVVAKYNGLEVKVDDKFVMGTTNKTDAWIAKFGASQVPAFEGTDGTIIIESGAIAYYRKSRCWMLSERRRRRIGGVKSEEEDV